MRRLLLLIAGLALSAGSLFAATETLYLKNGSVIKGEIIEQIPGQSLKIKTRDGSVFVYQMDEVEKITKESSSSSAAQDGSCNVRHRGLDFSIGTGYNIATKGGSGNIPVDVIVSKRFSPNFSAGLGAGAEIPAGDGKPVIPIFADFKGFFPLSSSRVTPFGDIRLGYGINTAEDQTVGSGKYRTEVEMPNYVTFSIMPGVRIPLSHRTDVDLSVGYQHYLPTKGGGGSGAIAFKVAFNFHRSTDPNFVKRIKPEIPTRNTGFEFGINAITGGDVGLGILLGYKWSPRLSFGLGISGQYGSFDGTDLNLTYYKQADGKGDKVAEKTDEDYGGDYERSSYKFFLRGQYRFTDRKFSPIATVDLGYRALMNKEGVDDFYWNANHVSNYEKVAKGGGNGVFVRPSVGISWRTTKNSYLELLVGYEITNGVSGVDKVINYSGNWGGHYSDHFESVKIKQDGRNFSTFFVSLGWKRTFSLFSRD